MQKDGVKQDFLHANMPFSLIFHRRAEEAVIPFHIYDLLLQECRKLVLILWQSGYLMHLCRQYTVSTV